jgi:hypothetical protein
MRFGCASGHGRIVSGNGLVIQVADLKDIDGDSAAIATTSPLGVLELKIQVSTNR